ncbi:Hpt domain-containing protein [Desulfonauticus submarinus]|uniref:Hpt domain-containing protein n=1 Tax=Desulfonauticus submarinus TaxID=206665 RepID=A0A1H0EZE5_9BACT|nr:Hpt domain-containing protein [Desulfonauticus submarinus]SDN87715.1 Hpt domain-containing protein [Desulfonauticus submarinus]
MNLQEIREKILAELKISKDKVDNFLQLYKENTEKELKKIRQKLKEQNLPQVKELIHKLKGTSLNLRIEDLGNMFADLHKKFDNLNLEEIDNKLLEIEKKFKSIFQSKN